MAKAAKQVDEFTPKFINATIGRVLDVYADLEVARGKFMNAARRYRDQIGGIYENAAAKGIPQRVMKLQVRIEQTQEKLTGLIADLEIENRRMLQRIAKMRENKAQLALFADLPKAPKPPKEAKAPKGDGHQLDMMEAAGAA